MIDPESTDEIACQFCPAVAVGYDDDVPVCERCYQTWKRPYFWGRTVSPECREQAK